jgi:hypothetical protein
MAELCLHDLVPVSYSLFEQFKPFFAALGVMRLIHMDMSGTLSRMRFCMVEIKQESNGAKLFRVSA